MLWFIIALAGALSDSVHALINKRILKDLDHISTATGVFLGTSLILLIVSLIKGIPELGDQFIWSVFSTAFLNVIAVLIFFKALKNLDLSLAVPILSFTPIFMIFTSFFLLGELPSIMGIFGIMFVVIGVYVMNFKNYRNLLGPLTNIFTNKYMFYMLCVAFIYSFSASIDKIVLLNSDPFFGSGSIFAVAGLTLLIIMKFTGKSAKCFVSKSHYFILTSFAAVLVAICINYAYTMQMASYVISIKRTSILFSVLFGCLVLREENTFKRLTGAIFMVIGVVLMLVF